MPCVYILQSVKNWRFYIGSTTDLERRLNEHFIGKNKSTKNLRPLQLVFQQQYRTIQEAHKIEMWLKRMKSRRLIEQIIQEGKIEHHLGSN